jgi:hypothetical protein
MSFATADAQRRAQAQTSAAVAGTVATVFGSVLDPYRLDATAPRFLEVASAAIVAGRRVAAAEAIDFYRTGRLMAGVTEPFEVATSVVPDPARLRTSLLVTGPIAVKQSVARGESMDTALRKAQRRVSGAAYRLTANGGRETIQRTIQRDRAAMGWARVSDGNPCSFCAMLVSRGAVFRDSSGLISERDELYHDGCGCSLQPVYTPDDPVSALTVESQRVWAEATEGLYGREAMNAFRRAWAARA